MGRVTGPWIQKLDATLRRRYEKSPDGVQVDCLVRTDQPASVEVEQIIRSQGGVVRHHIKLVPGLSAEMPVEALCIVASSDHVLQIDADYEYTAAW